nr:MAG TPA: hypothetical protein [Caudoviricetes sp.]
MRADLVIAVVVAALGSPLLLSAARAAAGAWRSRRSAETEAQRWRRIAYTWEVRARSLAVTAVRHGVPVDSLPPWVGDGVSDPDDAAAGRPTGS